jgi:hypothetical protein
MRLRTSLFQRISLSLFFFVLVYALYRYPTEASAFISAAVPSNFKSVSESQRFVLTLEPVNDRSEVDKSSRLRHVQSLEVRQATGNLQTARQLAQPPYSTPTHLVLMNV